MPYIGVGKDPQSKQIHEEILTLSSKQRNKYENNIKVTLYTHEHGLKKKNTGTQKYIKLNVGEDRCK